MRRKRLIAAGLGVAALLLLIGVIVWRSLPLPLSPLEMKLVGTWAETGNRDTRSFLSDRSLLFSDGQFLGRWSMKGNRLEVEYWQPASLREITDIDSTLMQMRRLVEIDTAKCDIEFQSDGKSLLVTFPYSGKQPPVLWVRPSP